MLMNSCVILLPENEGDPIPSLVVDPDNGCRKRRRRGVLRDCRIVKISLLDKWGPKFYPGYLWIQVCFKGLGPVKQ